MQRKLNNAVAKPCLIVVLVALGLLLTGTVTAQDETIREGYFEVRSASTTLVAGVHALDARLQLVLSNEALDALSNGVPLTIELQMQIIRARRMYFDAVDAELDGHVTEAGIVGSDDDVADPHQHESASNDLALDCSDCRLGDVVPPTTHLQVHLLLVRH